MSDGVGFGDADQFDVMVLGKRGEEAFDVTVREADDGYAQWRGLGEGGGGKGGGEANDGDAGEAGGRSWQEFNKRVSSVSSFGSG